MYSLLFPISDSRLMLQSFIHLELSFVQSENKESAFFPLHVAIKVSQHHLLKMLSTAVIIVGLLRDYCRSAVSFSDQWVCFEARAGCFY